MIQKKNKISTKYWSIKIPLDCLYEMDMGVYSIFYKNGYGVVNISHYEDNKIILNKDLLEIIDIEQKFLKKIHFNNFSGFCCVYDDFSDNSFWKKYWLKANNIIVYITYNCKIEDKNLEREFVEELLVSLDNK